ncbi:MAG: hypothetical protein AAF702_27520 [Chloroflexota bacterium]
MLYLLVAILIIAVSMALVAKFMMWLVDKTTAITLTQRFQDAEYILTYHQAPSHWSKPRSPFVRFMQGANMGNFMVRLRHALAGEVGTSQSQQRLLTRLDDLIDFFESCPFFEDEGSRDLMLDQLWDERDQWEEQGEQRLEESNL